MTWIMYEVDGCKCAMDASGARVLRNEGTDDYLIGKAGQDCACVDSSPIFTQSVDKVNEWLGLGEGK